MAWGAFGVTMSAVSGWHRYPVRACWSIGIAGSIPAGPTRRRRSSSTAAGSVSCAWSPALRSWPSAPTLCDIVHGPRYRDRGNAVRTAGHKYLYKPVSRSPGGRHCRQAPLGGAACAPSKRVGYVLLAVLAHGWLIGAVLARALQWPGGARLDHPGHSRGTRAVSACHRTAPAGTRHPSTIGAALLHGLLLAVGHRGDSYGVNLVQWLAFRARGARFRCIPPTNGARYQGQNIEGEANRSHKMNLGRWRHTQSHRRLVLGK